MQKGVLHDLLKTLTNREKKAFADYVQSPHAGASPDVQRLAKRLLNPAGPPPSLDRQNKAVVFPSVFGRSTPYDDARLRKTMERLLRLLEQFLVSEQWAGETFEFRLRLAVLLAERKQEKLLRRLLEAPLPWPEQEADWTTDQFDQAARWYQFLYDHRSNTAREHDPELHRRCLRCQTVALLARRLRAACIFRSNQKERAAWPPDPLLDWAAAGLPQMDHADLPLLQILFAGYQALSAPDTASHFSRFREGLLAAPPCLTRAERRDLLLVAINFCSQRYNAGDTSWLDAQLELYDYGLREALLLENGWVTGYTFLNIGTLALIGRRHAWLEDFLAHFRDKVEPRYRESAVAFNQARLDYACQRYRPALAQLQQDLFDDVLLNLSAKIVQAKCFQELGEHDLLEAHLEAMRKYIRRHKELGQYAARYLNFTTVLRRILRVRAGRQEALRTEIGAMSVLAEKDWLLARL